VAHTCNPSYWGGRDQEDCGVKPANNSRDPLSKNPNTEVQLKIFWLYDGAGCHLLF
jgi:hypothetical protein